MNNFILKQKKNRIFILYDNKYIFILHIFALCFWCVAVFVWTGKKERQQQNPKWKCKCRAISWNRESINRYTTHARTHIQANGIVLFISFRSSFFLLVVCRFLLLLRLVFFFVDYVSFASYLFSHTLSHWICLSLLLILCISWFAFTCFRTARIFAFFAIVAATVATSFYFVQQFCHLFPMLFCTISRSIFKVLFFYHGRWRRGREYTEKNPI